MKKVLIICAAGMSSSVMAMKTTRWLNDNGHDISIDAIGVTEGNKMIESNEFDLFLISPQTRMYLKKFQETGKKSNKKVISIPPQAYVPIPQGIEKLGKVVLENLD